MIRTSTLLLSLLLPFAAVATEPGQPAAPGVAASADVPSPAPAPSSTAPSPAANPPAALLPPMWFVSSVAEDDVAAQFKANPMFASIDEEMVGSPLVLVVTHTVRPTAGGQAAGLVSAILSGSTLGLLPVVTNDRLVVRYEVRLNGTSVASHTVERTSTRAQSLWTAGSDAHGGLGKAGLEWVKSTAAEAAAKLAQDPAVLAVRDEIALYFPERKMAQ